MLAYIPAPWILWVPQSTKNLPFSTSDPHRCHRCPRSRKIYGSWRCAPNDNLSLGAGVIVRDESSHWSSHIITMVPGWWFGTWLLFTPIVGMIIQYSWDDDPIWLSYFFRGVETTNQLHTAVYRCPLCIRTSPPYGCIAIVLPKCIPQFPMNSPWFASSFPISWEFKRRGKVPPQQ